MFVLVRHACGCAHALIAFAQMSAPLSPLLVPQATSHSPSYHPHAGGPVDFHPNPLAALHVADPHLLLDCNTFTLPSPVQLGEVLSSLLAQPPPPPGSALVFEAAATGAVTDPLNAVYGRSLAEARARSPSPPPGAAS